MASVASARMAPESERDERKVLANGVRKPGNVQVITIPLKFFRFGAILAITVRSVHSQSAPKKGYLIANIPGMPKVSAREIKITQIDHRLTPEWVDFVVENLNSIVDNYTTVAQFEKWSESINGPDASFLLDFLWTHANKTDRFWRIAKSQVKIARKWWPNARSTGSGLFCIREGKYDIEFGTCPETCWVQEEPKTNCPREQYGLGPEIFDHVKGENIKGWCVPSDLSLRTGLIHHGFKVNFVCKKNGNPTHKLKFEDGRFYLAPRRKARVGEEFTYDYNYTNPK